MLLEKINADLTVAIKAGQKHTKTALRGVLAEVQNERIKLRVESLDDDQVLTVVLREAKKYEEACEAAWQAERNDVWQKNNAMLVCLYPYMPEEIGEDDVNAIITQAIEDTQAQSIGAVMKIVMPQVKGKFDSKEASAMVKARMADLV